MAERTTTKKDLVKKLRKEGNSYEQIGKMVGLTRQRVHQILSGYLSPSEKARRLEVKLRKK